MNVKLICFQFCQAYTYKSQWNFATYRSSLKSNNHKLSSGRVPKLATMSATQSGWSCNIRQGTPNSFHKYERVKCNIYIVRGQP